MAQQAHTDLLLAENTLREKQKMGEDHQDRRDKPEEKLMASTMKASHSLATPLHAATMDGDGKGVHAMGSYHGTMVSFEDVMKDPIMEEEDDEIIDIDVADVEAAVDGLKSRWLVIGLFYTKMRYNPRYLWEDISVTWGLKVPAPVRELEQNRFLIEFDCERTFNFVTTGGPWRHKGEAFIVVPYDGVSRATEMSINSIALWVRIFDLLEFMMNDDYAKSLGGKLGIVLELGGAIQNFLCVRVDYPLCKPLRASFKVRIKGHITTILIKYENVPNFCFVCGTLGMRQTTVKMRS
ncbi:hypothetical protein QOZ80_1AG0034070 [Eleusine coracana subsp. coracana]|nr:hypothetical protein QOZ80_1AG0034070 [Eleusine coracana subsp. coracana]